MKKVISLFPHLNELYFELWPPWCKGDRKIPDDIKMAHVKDWKLACPELRSVSFIDGSALLIRKSGSVEWSPFPLMQ